MSEIDDELLEQLADRWEDNVEELGEASGAHDVVAPIESATWLVAIMELRYLVENGELPESDDDLDAQEYTSFSEVEL